MSLFVATSGSMRHLTAPAVLSQHRRAIPPTVRSSGATCFEPGSRRPSPVIRVTRHPRSPSAPPNARNRQPYLLASHMSAASGPTATSQLSVAAKALATVIGHPPIAFRLRSAPSPEQRPRLLPGSATRSCCGSSSSTSIGSLHRQPRSNGARDAAQGRSASATTADAELRGRCRGPSSFH